MPKPGKGESKDDFIKRCIPFVIEDGTAKDGDQAFAVCQSMWEQDKKAMDVSLEKQQNDIWRAFDKQLSGGAEHPAMADGGRWLVETYEDHVIASVDGKYYKISYSGDGGEITFADRSEWTQVEEKKEWIEVVKSLRLKAAKLGNCLKTVSKTDEELRVANYMVLFGGRDLEGIGNVHPWGVGPRRKNADGTIGEYFTKSTKFDSPYTETGVVYVDWEHGEDPDEIGLDENYVFGYVDWKTAKIDDQGLFVERVLSRRKKYMEFIEPLIEAGLIGNSSEAVRGKVSRKTNGEIETWPVYRDTLTVMPAEPRMMKEIGDNALRAIKALADAGLIQQAQAQGEEPPGATDKQAPDFSTLQLQARAILFTLEE